MDKNKSVFKLKGLPNSYWLNLDADEHRRIYMEAQFKYWEIENHTRISGYDGRTDDVCQFLKGRAPDTMSENEIGCCMSHLKAIKHFYEETDDPYALIFEDDVVFNLGGFRCEFDVFFEDNDDFKVKDLSESETDGYLRILVFFLFNGFND